MFMMNGVIKSTVQRYRTAQVYAFRSHPKSNVFYIAQNPPPEIIMSTISMLSRLSLTFCNFRCSSFRALVPSALVNADMPRTVPGTVCGAEDARTQAVDVTDRSVAVLILLRTLLGDDNVSDAFISPPIFFVFT